MEITILDHNFSVLSETPSKLKDVLSYQQKSFNRRTKKWRIDHFSLIDFSNNSIYTGLVSYILDHFPSALIIDKRVFPEINLNIPDLSTELRNYQIDYLLAALKERRMIVHADTGAGKTLIMAAILLSLNLPTLIIAPNKTVMAQLQVELKRLCNITFGVASGEKVDINHKFVIGLVGTLIKLPVEDLKRFKVLLIDEVHQVAAQQAHDVVLSTQAPYRFGFTGTPTGRSDGRDLVVQGLVGKIVKLIERDTLVEQGYLANTMVDMYRGAWDGDYQTLEDLLIVKNPKRNALIKKIVDNHDRDSVLILVRRIEHGQILQQMFGRKSIFISGESLADEREEVRQDVKNGKYKILIASNIFAAGLDIPSLELGINARGGKSDILTAQGAGRITRAWNQMAKTWVDIYDSYCHVMEEHSKERIRIYREQGIHINFIGFPPGLERSLEKENL